MNISRVFSAYNYIRAKAPQSYKPRINRALGVAQLKTERPYQTTLTTCTCPDFYYRGVICKHIIAKHLALGMENAQKLLEMLSD